MVVLKLPCSGRCSVHAHLDDECPRWAWNDLWKGLGEIRYCLLCIDPNRPQAIMRSLESLL